MHPYLSQQEGYHDAICSQFWDTAYIWLNYCMLTWWSQFDSQTGKWSLFWLDWSEPIVDDQVTNKRCFYYYWEVTFIAYEWQGLRRQINRSVSRNYLLAGVRVLMSTAVIQSSWMHWLSILWTPERILLANKRKQIWLVSIQSNQGTAIYFTFWIFPPKREKLAKRSLDDVETPHWL